MPFQKGNKHSTGRKKGALNKDKKIVREMIEAAMGGTIPEEMWKLAGANPRAKLHVLEVLMPYCYPRLQAVEVSGELETSNAAAEEVKELADWLQSTYEAK